MVLKSFSVAEEKYENEEEEEEEEDESQDNSPLRLRAELENIEDDIGEILVPAPPDGGWGWVVCIASFLCNLILDGIAYSFGVMLAPLCRYFGADTATVSWVGSILCGVYLMSGPIVGGLVNKFGCRVVCMSGSLIAAIAFSLSIFSPNVPVLMLLYGGIGGFGLGLIYLPSVVVVGYYFEKKRALATGISVCGSGVGTFIFAPLATALLDQYGWRGANLIFAALCLQCAVCGALMRPLELSVNLEEKEEDNEDKFVLNLPDGTSHKQFVRENDSGSHLDQVVPSPSHRVLPTLMELPTITEQSVTANNTTKEEHASIQDVFPARLPSRKRSRVRTTSESPTPTNTKFVISAIKSPSQDDKYDGGGKMTRNQSAPHFAVSQRNYSTTFGLPRVGSQCYSNGSGSIVGMGDIRRSQTKISVRPLSRKDIFYTGSITALEGNAEEEDQYKSQASMKGSELKSNKNSYLSVSGLRSNKQSFLSIHRSSLVNSSLALPVLVEGRRRASISIKSHHSQIVLTSEESVGIMAGLKEMMDFSLLKDPLFLLVGISNVFGMMGFYTPFVYLPNMAAQKDGISVEDASFLISLIGVSNTLGRVASGWLSDFPWVNSLVVTNMAIILSALTIFLFPLCNSYHAFVIMSLLFGLFVAAYISLTSIVLVDLCGIDNLTTAFGLLTLFRGSSSMIGPPITGMVFEATKSYNLSFYVSASFLLLAGLISCLVDLLKRRRDSKSA